MWLPAPPPTEQASHTKSIGVGLGLLAPFPWCHRHAGEKGSMPLCYLPSSVGGASGVRSLTAADDLSPPE